MILKNPAAPTVVMHTKGSVVYTGQPAAGDLGAEGTFLSLFLAFGSFYLLQNPAGQRTRVTTALNDARVVMMKGGHYSFLIKS